MGANGSVAHADTINDATTTVAGKASSSAGTKQAEPAAQSQPNAPQAKAPAEGQASTAEQATGQASEKASNASTDTTDTGAVAGVDNAKTKDQANETVSADVASNKMVMARVMPSSAGTVSAGGEKNTADNHNQAGLTQISDKKGDLSSLINRAKQDKLTVTKEDAKTYATKQEVSADLDNQVADIRDKVTKYESDKADYDAAKKVYDEDLAKWNAAQKSSDPHMVKGISQGLSFANEHDALLDVTSGSDKPVNSTSLSPKLGWAAMARAYILMVYIMVATFPSHSAIPIFPTSRMKGRALTARAGARPTLAFSLS